MNSQKQTRPIIFIGVGVFNTLFDFTIYTLLVRIVFSDSIALAGLVSGTAALFVAFTTHALVTWRGSAINRSTVLKFVAFTGFGMWFIRPLLLALFIQLDVVYNFAFKLSRGLNLPFDYDFVSNTGAFGFMIIIVLLYNYYVYDRYVFNYHSDRTATRIH